MGEPQAKPIDSGLPAVTGPVVVSVPSGVGSSRARTRLAAKVVELESLATTDALATGQSEERPRHRLASRSQFASRGGDLACLMIDLPTGLKRVNDTLGHTRGDDLIRTAGETIRRAIRLSDFAARLGGDEFLVVLPMTSAAGGCSRRVWRHGSSGRPRDRTARSGGTPESPCAEATGSPRQGHARTTGITRWWACPSAWRRSNNPGAGRRKNSETRPTGDVPRQAGRSTMCVRTAKARPEPGGLNAGPLFSAPGCDIQWSADAILRGTHRRSPHHGRPTAPCLLSTNNSGAAAKPGRCRPPTKAAFSKGSKAWSGPDGHLPDRAGQADLSRVRDSLTWRRTPRPSKRSRSCCWRVTSPARQNSNRFKGEG